MNPQLYSFSVANSSQPKYFEQPLPKWVNESACRGRNTRTIKNKSTWQPQVDELGGEELDQDDDAMSIAASEMTNWGGTNKIFRNRGSFLFGDNLLQSRKKKKKE